MALESIERELRRDLDGMTGAYDRMSDRIDGLLAENARLRAALADVVAVLEHASDVVFTRQLESLHRDAKAALEGGE